jgi:hypothetical protein
MQKLQNRDKLSGNDFVQAEREFIEGKEGHGRRFSSSRVTFQTPSKCGCILLERAQNGPTTRERDDGKDFGDQFSST